MTERRDDTNPLANSVRAALDRRASLTGEPDSERRDEMFATEAEKEKAKEEAIAKVKRMAVDMAEDEGLWFVAQTCTEAYLQQELRKLCAAIEAIT